jgi:hypothetical protein
MLACARETPQNDFWVHIPSYAETFTCGARKRSAASQGEAVDAQQKAVAVCDERYVHVTLNDEIDL